jgi:hypothetical protein
MKRWRIRAAFSELGLNRPSRRACGALTRLPAARRGASIRTVPPHPIQKDPTMKKLFTALALAAVAATAAHAQGSTADQGAPTKQQEKMIACNKDAEGKKGDERKAFMSQCLKKKPEPTTQQDKMKVCNKQAGEIKGDERKKFMSDCLKTKPA